MPPRITSSTVIISPSPYTQCTACFRRSLSTTPQRQARIQVQTKLRRKMWIWLNTAGKNFVQPNDNTMDKTNYLTSYKKVSDYVMPLNLRQARSDAGADTEQTDALEQAAQEETRDSGFRKNKNINFPFPMNRDFQAQSILSEALRLEIWKRVQVDKQSVRQVSSDLSVDMHRVGAVVRLVEVERRMRAQGEELALPYAEAIHSMVETTPYDGDRGRKRVHEPINDLPHHSLTEPQLFYPTSESRAFSRTDAGRVFSGAPRLPDSQDIGQGGTPIAEPWADSKPETIGKRGHEMTVLKPADARIPHPHLVRHEQDKLDYTIASSSDEISRRYTERLEQDQQQRQQAQERRVAQAEEKKTRIEKGKWEFIFEDVVADRGVGHKYGVPSQDRKRGNIKIPTRVEV